MEELPKKLTGTGGQPASLNDVYGTSVKKKRYPLKPTDFRPSDIAESAGESERQFKMLPTEIQCEQPTLVFLSFDEPVATNEDEFQMEVHLIDTNPNYSRRTDVIWLNPFSCYFMAGENPPGRVTVRVYEKGTHIGSRELRYQSKQSELSATVIELLLRHIRLLCDELLQLGAATEHLDQLLASVFDSDEKNTQEHLFVPYRYLNNSSVTGFVPGTLELPTMLHLAAKYGFSELCSRLTDLPSAHYAYRLTNSSGWLPEDLAVQMGHDQLATLLETFREVRDGLESVYVACRNSHDKNSDDDKRYLTMYRFETEKSIQDDQSHLEDQGDHDLCEDKRDNLFMIEVKEEETAVVVKSPVANSFEKRNIQPIINTDEVGHVDSASVVTSLTKKEDSYFYSSSQKELLNLMNQVKNQVLTIAEAEVLFKEWKLRFHDKSASFKQKQAMLTKMRTELTHLQCQIKKGFFNKIVSRLKRTKSKRTESNNYQSDDSISEDKYDETYSDIPEELQGTRIKSSCSQRITILESSEAQSPPPSPPPPPLPPHLVLRSEGKEDSDSDSEQEREALYEIYLHNVEDDDDDDPYVVSDPLQETNLSPDPYYYNARKISLASLQEFPRPSLKTSLSSDPYDYQRKTSLAEEFSHPSERTCSSPDSAKLRRKTILSPDGKLWLPVTPKPNSLVTPSPLERDKSLGEVSDSDYVNHISPPTTKHPVPKARQTKIAAKAQTLDSALRKASSPRKWLSSSELNEPEEEAENALTTPAIVPRKAIRDLKQDCNLSSSLPSTSILMMRNTSDEAKELCGSRVKKEINK